VVTVVCLLGAEPPFVGRVPLLCQQYSLLQSVVEWSGGGGGDWGVSGRGFDLIRVCCGRLPPASYL
jgi:hypothetical protein